MPITRTQEFISHITKHGVARSNRFEVIIPLPRKLLNKMSNINQQKTSSIFGNDVIKLINSFQGGGGNEVTRGLNLMAESTELPGKSLATSDIKYNGDFYKQAYAVLYAEIPFVFRVSRDMYEKNIIDEWMNSIVDPMTQEVEYYDDYVTDITVNQLDETDNIVYSVILKDAYPMLCSPLSVSNEEPNATHRLACTVVYKKWIREGEYETKNKGYSLLSQTALGPILTPILSNPVVRKALEIFERTTGIDLQGEALNIYNQIDGVIRSTTGSSVNTTVAVLSEMSAEIQNNDKINNQEMTKLIQIIEDLINTLQQND